MLGTSARIGEVLAIRSATWTSLGYERRVRICGTIVSPAGKPTHRQHHPKTMQSTRAASLPSFTAEALGQRLVVLAQEEPEHLIFFSRNHAPLTTNNIRRRLRNVLAEVGITGVTPHSFRRTVATMLGPSWRRGPRRGDARTHILRDHQAALHLARRQRQPGDRRNPGGDCPRNGVSGLTR